ncbi:TauD/TfdA family dioxygenase [Streptomyces sp. NPDC001307]|uniref:TauD/TfdA family dioxygenase n=1 Tax=Streptomyces sp. NPDC001307 TaxID=3364560 RepID=UPI00369AF8F0
MAVRRERRLDLHDALISPLLVGLRRLLEGAGDLIRVIQGEARVPEFQVRFRRQPDSIAVWDNIAVQHYAVNDYYPQRRVMERIAIAGVPASALRG